MTQETQLQIGKQSQPDPPIAWPLRTQASGWVSAELSALAPAAHAAASITHVPCYPRLT